VPFTPLLHSQYDSSNLGLAMHHILYRGVRSDFLVAVGCLEGGGQASRKWVVKQVQLLGIPSKFCWSVLGLLYP